MRNFLLSFMIMFLSLYDSHAKFYLNSESVVKIHGTVVDKMDMPVAGAQVSITGTIIETKTDVAGQFFLHQIKEGKCTIHVSALGYTPVIKEVDINSENVLTLKIILEETNVVIPEVLITGKSDRLFSRIPGSVSFINQKELGLIHPLSGNEVFRRSPGVHVVDEEGAGMRVNIGIRGLDPDRSRTLLVLEDGVPVALAPYGEPEMYYTPPMDRMAGVEILKGSGQILYGPQTIGGVVNYVTAAPPSESQGKIRVQGGQGGYLNTLFQYGNTLGNAGYLITILKKRADKIGYVGFDITDVAGKFVLQLGKRASVSFKAGFYDETSNSTYIGLTQTMFDKGGQDFVLLAPDDKLTIRRYNASLQHEYKWTPKTRLKTSAFVYTTTRNWRRQDFASNNANNTKPSNWTGVTWGNENVTGGAIYMRKSTANRDRKFEVAGIATDLEHRYAALGREHIFKAGIRYLYEKAYEQRINGSAPDVSSGSLVEDETRPGNAMSVYLHQTTQVKNNFRVHYGVRLESFAYGRDINRRSFMINGQNVIRDTILKSENHLAQLIPGAGFTWTIRQNTNVFGGIHAGFAPPRTKDAISNVGEIYDLDAERSINTELGVRSEVFSGVSLELTIFHMNFSNQIIPVSESGGGTGSGLVNGGSTLHRGIESGMNVNISEILGWSKTNLFLNSNITFIDAHFTGDRQQKGESLEGNKTPYAPNWLVNSTITWETLGGLSLRLTSNYVAEQYSDELNTEFASPDGRTGRIPAFHTLDAGVGYHFKKWNTSFQLSAKNITNERYIASRRPQGIRLGLPRWIMAGVEYNF